MKKAILSVLLVLTLLLSAFPATAQTTADLTLPAYNDASLNPHAVIDWFYGCCRYAWGRVYEDLGHQLPGWGNAIHWPQAAAEAGYTVSTTPRKYSLAIWSHNGAQPGHVAYVEDFDANTVYITEGGWHGEPDWYGGNRYCHADAIPQELMTPGAVRSPFANSPILFVGYIYLPLQGWQYETNHWKYYQNNTPLTGWQKIEGNWFYFDNYSQMQTGWLQYGGVWYYLRPSGIMHTGWLWENGRWYYFGPGGQWSA